MKAIIAGAGIGGLTAALCLHHFGHDVTVYEKSSLISEAGAGLQIPPNAMRVLTALGLEDAILARAVLPLALEARMGRSGLCLFRADITPPRNKRWGAPYVHIHRADYIDILQKALAARHPKALHLGSRLTGYHQDGSLICGLFEDGKQTPMADLLIGADGIHSSIRAFMLGDMPARFTGNMAWRVTVPADELGDNVPDQTACVWMGEGRHAVTYRLRGGALINFVGVVEQSNWTDESWTRKGSKEQALTDFSGSHPVITNLIETAREDGFYRWALFDRPPLARWTDGGAALLGDAAHPMLPFMAQGAAMATEDAWVLSALLDGNVKASLKRYADIRLPRASKVQMASLANMTTFHKSTGIQKLVTYGPMWVAGRLCPWAVRRRFDWLYGYDVKTATNQISN